MLFCWTLLALWYGGELREDTANLAKHLERFRNHKVYELQAAEYESVQSEYLGWVDSRVRAGVNVRAMNDELKAANLLSDGPQTIDDQFGRTYAGFLDSVGNLDLPGAGDLQAIQVGIHTGGSCNLDQTVVLYSRKPWRKIAQINAEHAYSHGYILRALAVGNHGSAGRIVASEWVASNCTSNWNGNIFRIDLSLGSSVKNVLNRDMSVFGSEDVTLKVENDIVACHYTSGFGDPDSITRDGVVRYRVQAGHAIRLPPIAKSYGGFIDEWLGMDDAEAARWATPQASAYHHELAARYTKNPLAWRQAANCSGSPP
jgi:hypothetical protein